ncbi:ArsR family transcriptional regulator [Paramagnetospirillum kuznetsovii]|uniref:ArsR family transcriptional regulator n=1 Tax=Paramagnetospirillum kuznetsovii TaxID=2053833 RepID=A0A364NXI6_9PROT|nr:metalloregulator ArsR/SmtB family transcription factor [Paramagnetospirillum kuznetsovii]RAU21794.1 ArsR family transcriptional regulator [Paramagnetospirillum kuznetsovii]
MIETFETVAKAVADPSRVRILKLLEAGELCVCQITTILGLATPTISKHLAALKVAGLLQQRRDGKWVYYRLAERAFNLYAPSFLAMVAAALADDPTIVEDRRLLTMVNEVPVQVLCDQGRAALPAGAASANQGISCCGGPI